MLRGAAHAREPALLGHRSAAGGLVGEATMAKRRKHRASEGQDTRSERPATGVGSPEPVAKPKDTQVGNLCYVSDTGWKPVLRGEPASNRQYDASPFAGPPSRIAAASPTPIRVQPMSR